MESFPLYQSISLFGFKCQRKLKLSAFLVRWIDNAKIFEKTLTQLKKIQDEANEVDKLPELISIRVELQSFRAILNRG